MMTNFIQNDHLDALKKTRKNYFLFLQNLEMKKKQVVFFALNNQIVDDVNKDD